jgi:alkaline phosphatase
MGVNTTRLFEIMDNNIDYGDGEEIFYGYYLPYQGFSRTNSLSGTTDSAAGGTALSCGIKTINYYVGQDENHAPVQSLTELAGSLQLSTAVMSTETETGATPAAFSAHVDDRNMSGEIIASQQELQTAYGTIINCGYDFYTPNYMKWIEKTLNETLDTLDDNEKGFFLMYEEAHTDKHGHNNDMPMAFQAIVRFNQVIARVMEYSFYHPNTFVLITADHETGGLTEENGTFVYTTDAHTGVDVPVFVYGQGGEVFNGQTVENIQIPQTIAAWLGEPNFGDQSQFGPLVP